MTSHYLWFRTANEGMVDRCVELMNKAYGSQLVNKKFRMTEEGEPTDPALYGTMTGAGPDAGTNPGANMVGTVYASVSANEGQPASRLNDGERLELVSFFEVSLPLDDAWNWDPASPDYGTVG